MSTTNQTYGTFSQLEDKYQKASYKDRVFEDFFKAYVNNENKEKSKLDESIKNIRLYDSSYGSLHVQQPADNFNLGKRHMLTQDGLEIGNKTDKLFMAQHNMSKYPSIIPTKQAEEYIDKFVPYYKDKEVTFWSTNLEKSNMYKTHSLGINPFAKSNAFTEPIGQTKGGLQYQGNTTNLSTSKNIYLNQQDCEFMDKYQAYAIQTVKFL
jgi:hypothetical protein